MCTNGPFRTSLAGASFFAIAVVLCTPPHSAVAQTASTTLLFSGVASAGGANGTQWRSEVVLSNPWTSAVAVKLELVERDATALVASTTLTLAARETRRLPDLYVAMGAPSGAGTLRVTGDALAWVRTYNQGGNGTFGMDVPGVTAGDGFAAGTPVLFPIETPANASREFRSNLLVTNLGSTRMTLTLSAGAAVRTYDVPPGTFSQISGVGAWLGAPNGSSMLTAVSTGRWSGLVTSIDPVLGDPTGMRGTSATARSVTVFPGVASASGMNGTLWRSEARIYNPGISSRSVKLEILPRDGSTVAASTNLTLGPLEMKSLPDVYAAVGAPGGAGALRVTGDVRTWVRTFNKGPEATFGTDVPEVVPGVAFGAGARVAFPVYATADVTTGFRSNFLVFNHEAREIACTFRTAAGASATLAVPAGSFVQQSNLGDFLGLAPGTTTVSVSANGRWSAIVTAIDPYLGDPTTVLGLLTTVNPVPTGPGVAAGDLVSASIGPAGGSFTSSDGRATLTVPAGALSGSTTFTLQPFTNLAWGGLGPAYEMSPADTAFAAPARLTVRLTADDVAPVSLGDVGIAQQDQDGYWFWTTGPERDVAARSVSVALTRLGPATAAVSQDEPPAFRQELAFVPRYRFGPAANLWLEPVGTTVVKKGESQQFWVEECFPPYRDDNAFGLRTIFRIPASGGCFPYRNDVYFGAKWFVGALEGGNATVGTIAGGGNREATYTAPAKVPSPDTVAVSVSLGDTADLQNVSLVSHVKVTGPDYQGTFNLSMSSLAGVKVGAKGEANLAQFMSDANGAAFDMTGTITVDSSFPWYGMTCSCTDAVTKAIPADTVFAIQRKPSLAQRWVMPAVSWNFKCNPDGPSVPVALQYFVAPPGSCSTQAWVPLSDESRLAGSYSSACNPAFTVNGSWSFQAQ